MNANYQTSSPHFCAVGDVIGFLSLASTSMEQGGLAACDAFGAEGKNEEQLTADGVPYEVAMRSTAKSRAVRLSAIRPAC